jgi:hypothetical protein
MGTKNLISLLLFVTSFLHSGCSVAVHTYLRNNSNTTKEVVLTFRKVPEKETLFHYGDLVEQPKSYDGDAFTKTIAAKPTQKGEYSFMLPAQSIVYLEQCINFRSLRFQSVKVANTELIETSGLYKQVFKKTRERAGMYIIWFDIK